MMNVPSDYLGNREKSTRVILQRPLIYETVRYYIIALRLNYLQNLFMPKIKNACRLLQYKIPRMICVLAKCHLRIRQGD